MTGKVAGKGWLPSLVGALLLLGVLVPGAFAQVSLKQLEAELVSTWLVKVQGGGRLLKLEIHAAGDRGNGLFLLDADYGWIESRAPKVRAEVEQKGTERILRILTPLQSLIVATQLPDGSFSGTYTPDDGPKANVRIEKISEAELRLRVREVAKEKEQLSYGEEAKDWGIEPVGRPRVSSYHAPTPTTLPGGRVVRTFELLNMLMEDKGGPNESVVVVDVLGGVKTRSTVPGAHWMPGAGEAPFHSAEMERFSAALGKITGGNRNRPLVFLCLNSECWLSYNASLHAIEAGYKQVIWYRGGTRAWNAADQLSRRADPMKW